MRLASFLVLTAAVAAAPLARAQSAPAPDAQVAYEQEAIGVRSLVYPLRDGRMADEQGRVRYDGRWDAFHGPDHHPIDQAAFYRIVGRDDLLTRYEHRARVKVGVSVGGGVLLLGGTLLATVAQMMRQSQGVVDCASPGCGPVSSSQGISPAWGLAVAGTGLVGLVVAHYLDPTPIGADEADRLARDYDQSLRSRLRLTDTARR